MQVTRILSGGQTGADRAALDAAVALGLPYGGWCPPGGWAEDLTEPPGLLARYPMLEEATDTSTRTRWNVRDSDATLVLLLTDLSVSAGTRLTVEVAAELGRPWLVTHPDDVPSIVGWLADRDGGVLNVAGPRETEDPGIYAAAYDALLGALG